MSPQTKHDTKWILTVIGSIIAMLLTAVTLTAKITTKFNTVEKDFVINEADHTLIKKELASEIIRSTKVDADRAIIVKEINGKLDALNIRQTQILEAIKEK